MPRTTLSSLFATLLPLLIGVAPVAHGQSAAPDTGGLRPPGLIVRPDPKKPEVPLALARVGVEVVLRGGICRTTLDLTFRNPNDRVLAGRFAAPLPPDATPVRFAMEVDGALREGAFVTRERGRVVFETIVRKGADPGLLEWVQGSAFRARIYPIPANGTKRVVIAYEQELAGPAPGADRERVRVPLSYGAVCPDVMVKVKPDGVLASIEEAPAWKPFQAEDGSFGGAGKDVFLGKDLVLSVRDRSKPGPLALVARGPDGLAGYVRVAVAPGMRERPNARRIALAWDASASHTGDAVKKELAALNAYLKVLGDVSVHLVVFSDVVWFTEEHQVTGGDSAALSKRIARIIPDGATSFAAAAKAIVAVKADEVLVLSDGLETLDLGGFSVADRPVFVITASGIRDAARLGEIAWSGRVVDAARLDPAACVQALRREPLRFLGLQALADRVTQVEPAAGAIVGGTRFAATFRIRGEAPLAVTLQFGYPGQVVQSVEAALNPAGAGKDGMIPRAWARRRVARLGAHQEENATEITELARRYGLVTPLTSLIVLETLEDYLRYEVVPPKPLQEAYFKVVEGKKRAVKDQTAKRMQEVARRWAERQTWWETEVTLPPRGWRWRAAGSKRGPRAGGAFAEDGGEGDDGADHEEERESPSGTATPTSPPPAPRPDAQPTGDPGDRPATGGMRGVGASGAGGRGLEGRRRAVDALVVTAEAKKDKGGGGSGKAGIAIRPWDPKQPYLKSLKEAGDRAYERYLQIKGEYARSPAFFVDCADFFWETRKDKVHALRVLSNLAELELGSARLLRVLAHRCRQLGALERARSVFAVVLRLRPEEPQSHRDLGLVLCDLKRFEEAAKHLDAVVRGSWDDRFPDVEIIALGELQQARALAARAASRSAAAAAQDVDLRIVLTWDADLCDIDLWVIEPTGEKAYYQNRRTRIGGWFGRDFTGGYGPEEYLLRKAVKGTYQVKVHYYGDSQQEVHGATTLQVEVFRNYGRANEERVSVTRRLVKPGEDIEIAKVNVD